jgi:hypothetical protein
MAQCKFTLYKYIKLAHGSWRYCKGRLLFERKIKSNRCVIGGQEEGRLEGAYYLCHKKDWIPVSGTDGD